ncbi:MAG: hypothetical protein H7A36_06945 [Chlamydiales bacterium]|nr:hypothetical protein [Chlamydiales bacterium]
MWKILFITAMMPLCAELNFRAGPGVTPFFPLPAVTVGLDSVSKHVAFGSTFQVVPSIHAPVSYVGVHAVPLFRPTKIPTELVLVVELNSLEHRSADWL